MCPYILPGASWVLHGPCYLPTAPSPLKPDLNCTPHISRNHNNDTELIGEENLSLLLSWTRKWPGQVTTWRYRISADPLQLSKYPRVTHVNQWPKGSGYLCFWNNVPSQQLLGLITVDKSQHDDRAAIQMPGWRIGTWWPPRPVMCAPSVTAPTWLARINHTVSGLCAHWGSGTADLCTTISQDQWPLAMELADHQYSYRAGEGCDCDVTTNQW